MPKKELKEETKDKTNDEAKDESFWLDDVFEGFGIICFVFLILFGVYKLGDYIYHKDDPVDDERLEKECYDLGGKIEGEVTGCWEEWRKDGMYINHCEVFLDCEVLK